MYLTNVDMEAQTIGGEWVGRPVSITAYTQRGPRCKDRRTGKRTGMSIDIDKGKGTGTGINTGWERDGMGHGTLQRTGRWQKGHTSPDNGPRERDGPATSCAKKRKKRTHEALRPPSGNPGRTLHPPVVPPGPDQTASRDSAAGLKARILHPRPQASRATSYVYE